MSIYHDNGESNGRVIKLKMICIRLEILLVLMMLSVSYMNKNWRLGDNVRILCSVALPP